MEEKVEMTECLHENCDVTIISPPGTLRPIKKTVCQDCHQEIPSFQIGNFFGIGA